MRWPTLELIQHEENVFTRHMELMQTIVHDAPYKGYPAKTDRLYGPPNDFSQTGRIVIPDGSWQMGDIHDVPSIDEQLSLVSRGYQLDSRGRPLHPWFKYMISNIAIGAVTGKGAYWSWGPNRTVDIVAMHEESILLVRRSDTKQWALPGGFIDKGETIEQAATREFHEETSLHMPPLVKPRVIYDGPVVDPRLTLNAWPETTALHYQLYEPIGLPHAGDDAIEAAWVPIEAARFVKLFGSHQILIDLALQ